MKTLFPEQFQRTEAEAKALWEKAIFAFDTNILIHMYRYSEPAKTKLLEALQSLKDRIWVPNWVASEFLNQRLDRISDHIKAYDDAKKSLETIQKTVKSDRHPFLPEELQAEFDSVATRMIDHFVATGKDHESRLNNDDTLITLDRLIEENVGTAYTEERLDKIAAEGVLRYQKLIPPGFKDIAKNDPAKPFGKYGDLIIWNQLIDKATEAKLPIIFICDDDKEDWILKKHGRTIGPLPALRKEFFEKSGQEFHSYSAGRFVEYYNEQTGSHVSEEILSEFEKVLYETSLLQYSNFDHLQEELRQADLPPLKPYVIIFRSPATQEYHWQLYILGHSPWIQSSRTFDSVTSCRNDLLYVRNAARFKENVRVVDVDNGFEVTIFDSGGSEPIVETVVVWEDYGEAIEVKKQLFDDFQRAQIVTKSF